ncbi:MAG: hypothetical protein BRC58_02245 [Cyanobacteria bacterium QS_8_64_29]|nr:MAG: hypothetical protein BRC58_02245 [Cyanobacteria bacterium QS_8_64_29]
MNNPAMKEQPRHEPAGAIPLQQEASLLDWLEANGRLLAREVEEENKQREEDEEIVELMEGEERDFSTSTALQEEGSLGELEQ